MQKFLKIVSRMKKKWLSEKKYLPALPSHEFIHVYVIIRSNRTVLSHFIFVHIEKRGRHVPMNSNSCMVPRFPAFCNAFYSRKRLNLMVTNLPRRNLYFYWPDGTDSSGVFRSRCVSFISWRCLLLLLSTLHLIAFLCLAFKYL